MQYLAVLHFKPDKRAFFISRIYIRSSWTVRRSVSIDATHHTGSVTLDRQFARRVKSRILTCVSSGAGANVFTERFQIARGAVQTRRWVACVLDGYLAEAGGKSDRAGTGERRRATPATFLHPARAAVLAPWPRVTRVQMLAVLTDVLRRASVTAWKSASV